MGASGLGAFAFQNCHELVSLKINAGVAIPSYVATYQGNPEQPFIVCCRLSEIIDLRETPSEISDWTGLLRDIAIDPDDTPLKEIRKTDSTGIITKTTNYGTFLFHKTEGGTVYLCNVLPSGNGILFPEASEVETGLTSYEIAAYLCVRKNAFSEYNFWIPPSVSKIGKAAFIGANFNMLSIGYNGQGLSGFHIEFGKDEEAFLRIGTVKRIENYTDTKITTVTPQTSNAQTYINGYWFNFVDDDLIFLTGCDRSVVKGDITLPNRSEVGGSYEIDNRAFYSNSNITSVIIPEAVTYIHDWAFGYDYTLTSVTVEGNNLQRIGSAVFNLDNKLETVSLPNSVTYIGSTAFNACSALTNFTLPTSLEYFGETASQGESGAVFRGCSNLQSITIPAKVTEIKAETFHNCKNLKEVKFAKDSKLERIGRQAFGLTAITSLTIPASVTTIETNAFLYMSSLEQLYFEEGSRLSENTTAPWCNNATYFESLNFSNLTGKLPKAFNFSQNIKNATVFLPQTVDAESVNALIIRENGVSEQDKKELIVAYDKAQYNELINNASVSEDLKKKLYWETDVTFSIKKDSSTVDSVTQKKLASNSGASIKYTLIEDAGGRPYGWTLDEKYVLPSNVNSLAADPTQWMDSSDTAITADALIKSDGVEYSFSGIIKLIAPINDRREFSGEKYTLPDHFTVAGITDSDGNASSAIDVGNYTVRVQPAEGYEWLGGGTEVRSFPLEIYKKQVELAWYYNATENIGDGSAVYELDYFESLNANRFTARYGSQTFGVNNGMVAVKDGDVTGAPQSALSAGLYKLTVTDRNYEFTNNTLYVRVRSVVMDLGKMIDTPAFKLGIGDGEIEFNSGSGGLLYIYENASKQLVPSIAQLSESDGYKLKEIIQNASVARYRNALFTCKLMVKGSAAGYSSSVENATRKDIGQQTTVYTFTAKENYEFSLGELSPNGYTVSISPDNKTVTFTKVWYVARLDNALLMSNATSEDNIYSISGWTYGANAEFTLPRLMHGDEGENWASDDSRVTFSLRKSGVEQAIATNEARSRLFYYVNRYMPAGDYTLTFEVDGFDCALHNNWWKPDVETDAESYPAFSRICQFKVDKAKITIDESKLPKGDNGYLLYDWEITQNPDKALFFAKFKEEINKTGVLNTVKMTAPQDTYWGETEDGKAYFGEYVVKYNFARMNNEHYEEDTHGDLHNQITEGARGTYTVYFQIGMPNHYNLTDTGTGGRYSYYFTVIVYRLVDVPRVSNVTYTGLPTYPDIVSIPSADSELYETIWSSADPYVKGGQHDVWFKLIDNVHYRWRQSGGDIYGNIQATFTIEKAKNDWTQLPGIISWEFGAFDAEKNVLSGIPKFLDEDKTVHFAIATDSQGKNPIEGLEDMTAVNGVIAEEYRDALNSLAASRDGEAYYLIATVEGTENYETRTQSVRFLIDKGTNTWAVTPNVMQWKYNGYDSSVNLILGEARIQDADNPVVFKITSDKAGTTVIADSFSLEDGLVPKEVEVTLGSLGVGTYYLWSRVEATDSYSALQPSEPFEFSVTKALNGWKETLDLISWSYGTFDKTVNRILGAAVQGDITFSVLKDDKAVEGLEAFTEVNETVAGILFGLDVGEYKLTASVTVDANYEELKEQSILFTIAEGANEWLVSPSVIAWQYGEFDAELNRVLAKVTHGDIFVTFTNGAGKAITDEFKLAEDGKVPAEAAVKLKALDKGDYKLAVRVQTDRNYLQITNLQPIPFSVAPLNNDWLVSPSVIQWQYGKFDAATHLVLGAAKQGVIVFRVTDNAGNALTDSFSLTDGQVPAAVASVLSGLAKGDYKLSAAVTESGNYTALDTTVSFSVNRAENAWEQTVGITTWIEGKFSAEENLIEVKAQYGDVIVKIVDATDPEKEPYYEGALGTEELYTALESLGVGTYQLTAKVIGNEDYTDLVSESILFSVFEKPGLPWWAILLIVIGALGVAALILWILHEKGVLQMLTGKFVIAMRTKMTIDATIAAVRANKRAEEAKKSIAKAEALDRLEAARKARAEKRSMSPEERALALEEKAAAHAAKAAKSQKRAERLQKQASKLKKPEKGAPPADNAPETANGAADEVASADTPTSNTDKE